METVMSDTNSTPQAETPDNPQTTPSTPTANQGASEPTFTQADIDRIIADRLKRDREAQETKLKERYGVTDLGEVEKLLVAKRKADEAAMSELEKAQAEIETAKKQAEEALQAKAALEQQILADKRKQAFLEAVRAGGGTNPDRVYALLQVEKPNDYTAIFGDDATPDDGKLKALIKQVQADYTEYFGTAGAGSPSTANGIAPNSQQENEKSMRELTRKFRKL
jgi:hypothetical protein